MMNNKNLNLTPTIIAVILLTILAAVLYLISKSNFLENFMMISENNAPPQTMISAAKTAVI